MILIFAVLAVLQCISLSSCRSSISKIDPGDTPDQLRHLLLPLLNPKTPDDEIKVQVVPYKDYKNHKARQSKQPVPLKKQKSDVPLAIILADSFKNKDGSKRGTPIHIKAIKKKDLKRKLGDAMEETSESNEKQKPIIIKVDRKQLSDKNVAHNKHVKEITKGVQDSNRNGKVIRPGAFLNKRRYVQIRASSSESGSSFSSESSSASEDMTLEYEEWKRNNKKLHQKGLVFEESSHEDDHHKDEHEKPNFQREHHEKHQNEESHHASKPKDIQSSESSSNSASKESRTDLIEQKSDGKQHKASSLESTESHSYETKGYHNDLHDKSHFNNSSVSKKYDSSVEHKINLEDHHNKKDSQASLESTSVSKENEAHSIEQNTVETYHRTTIPYTDESHSHETKDHRPDTSNEKLHYHSEHTAKKQAAVDDAEDGVKKHDSNGNLPKIKVNGSEEVSPSRKESSESHTRESGSHSIEQNNGELHHNAVESEEKIGPESSEKAVKKHIEHNKSIEPHNSKEKLSEESVHQKKSEHEDVSHITHKSDEIRTSSGESQESNSDEKSHPESGESDIVSEEHIAKIHAQDGDSSVSRTSQPISEETVEEVHFYETGIHKADLDVAASQSHETSNVSLTQILPGHDHELKVHVENDEDTSDTNEKLSHSDDYVTIDEKHLYDNNHGGHSESHKDLHSKDIVITHHNGEHKNEKGNHNSYEVTKEEIPYEIITGHYDKSSGDLNKHHTLGSDEIIELLIISGEANFIPMPEAQEHDIVDRSSKEKNLHDILEHDKTDHTHEASKTSIKNEEETISDSVLKIVHAIEHEIQIMNSESDEDNADIHHKTGEHIVDDKKQFKIHNETHDSHKHDKRHKKIKNESRNHEISDEDSNEGNIREPEVTKEKIKKKNKGQAASKLNREHSNESSEELKSFEKLLLGKLTNYVKRRSQHQVDAQATKSYNLSFLFNRR